MRFFAFALLITVLFATQAKAWIANTMTFDYAPNRKSYIFDINRWYMNNPTILPGLRIWVDPRYFYAGDLIGTDYVPGISIRQDYNPASGVLRIYGTGAVSDWWGVINWMWFDTTNTARAYRLIAWNLGADYYFFRWSYRWYYWVSVTNPATVTWDTAMADCAGRAFQGNKGYLATSANWAEQYFVYVYSGRVQTWLASADDDNNNDHVWRWLGGPYKTYYDGGTGMGFWGMWCNTVPVGSYYPPWFFPSWYQDMFPNTGSIPPSWATFMKSCLKKYGNPKYCPDTPIQAITTCRVGCAGGAYCLWNSGRPLSNPPSPPISSPYQDPTWQQQDPNSKVQPPDNWKLPTYKETGAHKMMMATNGRWNDEVFNAPVSGYFCQFGGWGYWPPYWENGLQWAQPGCGFNTNQQACQMEKRCRWHYNNNSCEIHNCEIYNTPAGCRVFNDVCEWDNDPRTRNSCSRKYCINTFTSQSRCDGDSSCRWVVLDGIPQCNTRMCTMHPNPCRCRCCRC
jgi:hypothetical protein